MENKKNYNRRSRHCLSMDENMLEKLFHESIQQQVKNGNVNRSMNALGTVTNRELINFLYKRDASVHTSELCRIAREINSSQLEDTTLSHNDKFNLLGTIKYHSWPKHYRQPLPNQNISKYHNYGLKEEQECGSDSTLESQEDLLNVVKSGFGTDRSWTSPSELNIQYDGNSEFYSQESNLLKASSQSCEHLASCSKISEENTDINKIKYLSLQDVSRLIGSKENIRENLGGIINNDYKSKFNVHNNEGKVKTNKLETSQSDKDFDNVYYSVFKHDILSLIEDDVRDETPHWRVDDLQKLHQAPSTPSLPRSGSPSKDENNISMQSLERAGNYSMSSYSMDSDSGVGQSSELFPVFRGSDSGIEPPLFKKRADLVVQWFSGFSNEQKNILIQRILGASSLPQMHMLSLKMEQQLHKDCPTNCRDMLQWLPENVAYQILDYLNPVSLSNACQVNRTWHNYAMHHHLWQKFSRHPDYQLSSLRHREQILKHTTPNGTVQWRDVFVERYCLRQNWMKGRCKVKTLLGHTQGVSCVQFDHRRIVSGSSDKTIRVWDLTSETADPVLHLVGHSGTVRCLQLIGNRLVSGSADTTIKVWDLSVGSDWNMAGCRVTMIGHFDTVRCLQVDSEKVISGSYDKTIKVWDLKTGHCKLTLRGHSAAVLCVQFDDQKIVSGSSDRTIKVWSLFTGVCLATFRGHDDAVTCLQFNHSHVISGSLDCTLKFWNLNSGQCIGTIDWIRSEGHTRVVRCLQADRWKIVSAGDDKTLKIWCLESGERFVTLHKHTDGVTCLSFDDFIIVSGSYDKTVKVWDFTP